MLQQRQMDKLCDICGDVGYLFCLTTCIECHKSHEHIYCMQKILLKVPESWYCQVCRPCSIVNTGDSGLIDSRTVSRRSFFDKLRRPISPGEELRPSYKKQKLMDTGNGSSKVLESTQKIRPPKHGKVKFLEIGSIYAMSSGTKTKGSPTKDGFDSGTKTSASTVRAAPYSFQQKSHALKSLGHSKPVMKGSTQIRANLERRPSKTSQEFQGQKSPLRVPSRLSTPESLRKRNIVEEIASGKPQGSSRNFLPLTKKKIRDREVHPSAFKRTGSVASGSKEKNNNQGMQGSDRNAGKEVSLVFNEYTNKEDAFVRPCEDGKLKNPPSLEAAWKGSIQILDTPTNDASYDGFEAHHPGTVSRKAYEFSKGLPWKLQFLLRPRYDVWLEIFRSGAPSAHDIALYFFPGDIHRSKKKYESLIELIEKHDLCLRSCIGRTELLIFSSQQLPLDSHKLNQHFYLWGVFRCMKRRPTSQEQNLQIEHVPSLEYRNGTNSEMIIHEAGADELVDMDIDMVGGKDLERVDKRISLTVSNHSYERGDGSNSAFTTDDGIKCSPHAPSEVRATTFQPELKVKIEQQNDLNAPPGYERPLTTAPGFVRPVTCDSSRKGAVEKLCDAAPGFQRLLAAAREFVTPVTRDSNVQEAAEKLPDAPPGFQRPLASPHKFVGPVTRDFNEKEAAEKLPDAPPGFQTPLASPRKLVSPVRRYSNEKEAVEQLPAAPPGFQRPLAFPRKLVSPIIRDSNEKETVEKLPDAPRFQSPVTSPRKFLRPIIRDFKEKEAMGKLPDAPSGFQRPLTTTGFSRPVTGTTAQKGNLEKSHVKLPVPCSLDVPPGFSKPVERDGRDLSSEAISRKNEGDQSRSPLGSLKHRNGSSLKDSELGNRLGNSQVQDDRNRKANEIQYEKLSQTEEKKRGSLTPRTPQQEIRSEPVGVLSKGTSSNSPLPPTSSKKCTPIFPKEVVKSEIHTID